MKSGRFGRTGSALIIALASLLLLATVRADGIYRVVDEHGNVTYTDDPPAGQAAEKVQVPEANVVPSVQPLPRPEPRPSGEDNIPKSYEVEIVAPSNETHLVPGEFDLTVQVATRPKVHASHHLQLSDNGEVRAMEGMSFTINYVTPGTHELIARVLDERGRVLGSSGKINVYVHRANLNSPARKSTP